MNFRNWFRPPRHVLAIFVAVAVVSAGALVWLMWLLLEQDKTVEIQRRQERLEQAADRAAAVMQGALADIDVQLGTRLDPPVKLPAGVLVFSSGRDGIAVRPEGALLYYPEPSPRLEAPAERFAEAEQSEFARNDLAAAAQRYSVLSADPDKGVRAAALNGLARVHRRMQDYSAALDAYDRLLRIPGVGVSGLPAELIARAGRASVFEETLRVAELRAEAAMLDENLRRGLWQLTRSQYEFYSSEAKSWLGVPAKADDPDSAARAEAVSWLWENRSSFEPGARRLIQAGGNPALIIFRATSDGFVAAVAGPAWLGSLCREALSDSGLRCALTDAEGHTVAGQSPPTRFAAIRTAAAAKLPWILQVFAATEPNAASVSPQRRLLLWVAGVLAVVWFTGAAFIVRSIQRESRVAQLQSDFVAAVSHEFRSPLSSLCQISEMLVQDRFDSQDLRRQSYGILANESGRLHRLVEGLLDFGRFEAGAAIYHFEPVEIRAFLKTIVADFQQRIGPTGYSVELREPQGEIHLRVDREAMSRAIWNLLDNAVKYSPECRTVWVEVEQNRDRVSIAVCDRGLGIPIYEQREIFEKFVRGADSKARRIKGTGIGLAMVRHIVQAHGGEMLLASQPGEGSRFTMVLPEKAES